RAGPGMQRRMITEQLTEDDVDAIMSTVYCTSTDQARPMLTHVQLCDGYAMATDSYRMAIVELPDLEPSPIPKWVHPCVLPARGACRLDYDTVDVDGELTVAHMVKINGQDWPLNFDRKLEWLRLATGTTLTGRMSISAGAREEILD